MEKPIYLDNSATTKICDEALDVFSEVSREHFGNPSSLHFVGLDALKILDKSEKTVLSSIGAKDGRIVFTASGTEANNLAVFGRAYSKERYKKGAKIITTAGEHSSVGSPIDRLAGEGYEIVRIPTRGGVLDTKALEAALDAKTVLITMMMVNNETGALYDVAKVSEMMHRKCPDCFLHVDATQSFMKMPLSVFRMKIDMLTVSSHKIEGPKGVGALYISQNVITKKGIVAHILGGGQGAGLRSGTENLPGIASFAKACEVYNLAVCERSEYINGLRTYLIDLLSPLDVKMLLPEKHAPHILNVILPQIKSQTMLNYLSAKGICVSSGSACSSHAHHASNALSAYGISDRESDFSIRISLSHRNTKEELDTFVSVLSEGINTLQRVK